MPLHLFCTLKLRLLEESSCLLYGYHQQTIIPSWEVPLLWIEKTTYHCSIVAIWFYWPFLHSESRDWLKRQSLQESWFFLGWKAVVSWIKSCISRMIGNEEMFPNLPHHFQRFNLSAAHCHDIAPRRMRSESSVSTLKRMSLTARRNGETAKGHLRIIESWWTMPLFCHI